MKTPRAGYGQLTIDQIKKTASKLDKEFGGSSDEVNMFLLGFVTGLMFTIEQEGSNRYGMKADEYAKEALFAVMLDRLSGVLCEYAKGIMEDEEL